MLSDAAFRPTTEFKPVISSAELASRLIAQIDSAHISRLQNQLHNTVLFAEAKHLDPGLFIPKPPNAEYRGSAGIQWYFDVVARLDRHYCMNTELHWLERLGKDGNGNQTLFSVVFYLPFWPDARRRSPLYVPAAAAEYDAHDDRLMPGNIVGDCLRDVLEYEADVRTLLASYGYITIYIAPSVGIDTWRAVLTALERKTGLVYSCAPLVGTSAFTTNTFVLEVPPTGVATGADV